MDVMMITFNTSNDILQVSLVIVLINLASSIRSHNSDDDVRHGYKIRYHHVRVLRIYYLILRLIL